MHMHENVKEQLMREYKYRIEMHAHTLPASPCSEVSPGELVKTYADLGYDALVLANHFIYYLMKDYSKEEAINRFLNDYEETYAAGEKLGLKVYLGAEVRFNENINDYLIYGVDREILEKTYDYFPAGVKAFREEIKLENSAFIQAHPFRNGMELVSPELLDGIETFNVHPGHNSKIGQAAKYAYDNKLGIMTAGTDFHHPNLGHEGLSALRCKTLPKDSFELAEILKNGEYIIEIGVGTVVLP